MATPYAYHPESTPMRVSSFSNITVSNWQQFRKVSIDFHPQLTILTGANGAGKTTLLNILAKHFDWYFNNLAMRDKKGSVTRNPKVKLSRHPGWEKQTFEKMGNIQYVNGDIAKIVADLNQENETNTTRGPEYSIELLGQCSVPGLYIPSHRPTYVYQALESIPVRPNDISKKKAIEQFIEELRNKLQNVPPNYGENPKSSNYRIKETLTAWNAFGYGNKKSKGKRDFVENFEKFENILKILLPKTLKFRELKIEDGEVILNCDTKPFYIDSASGGITSIIDIAWQIFMYQENKSKSFVVIIDEIENHLHPALQREILPNLISAFPNVKFIISTHSPLMVNSVRSSHIYALRYEQDEVVSVQLDLQNKAKSSTQVLDEVLGVSFSMPIWAESMVDDLISKVNVQKPTEHTFQELRRDLSKAGLENLVPEAIEKVIKEDQQ